MAQAQLAFAAASWGVLMGVAPVLQIRRMIRERSSRDISLGYFTILMFGFLLWIGYGLAARNLALVIPNSVALLVAALLMIVALRLRGGAGARRRRAAASELPLVPRGQDDLGHHVGAQSELLGYLLRAEPLLVIQQRQLLL